MNIPKNLHNVDNLGFAAMINMAASNDDYDLSGACVINLSLKSGKEINGLIAAVPENGYTLQNQMLNGFAPNGMMHMSISILFDEIATMMVVWK